MRALSGRPRVLHVSADFPDIIDAQKTQAIKALVEGVEGDFDQFVYSLNRQSPSITGFLSGFVGALSKPRLPTRFSEFSLGEAVSYAAPPKGIFHASMLRELGDALAKRVGNTRGFDLAIGHKLTVEGLVVERIARHFGIPFGLSIQGDTDTKILAVRPDLRGELARIYHSAAIVFPFAPWSLAQVEAVLGKRDGPVQMLPCATDITECLPPKTGGKGLLSVFHLANARRKNLSAMVAATRQLAETGRPVPLAIVGGGSSENWRYCRKLVGTAEEVVLEGPLERAPLRQRMSVAAGFVLPSRRESFGLVFIEALFCGLPIIYPSGTSVDGYLDGLPFAMRVDARDTHALAEAMHSLVSNEADLKAQLAEWQQSTHAARFQSNRIISDFRQGLLDAVA